MAQYYIVQFGEPVLREKAQAVKKFNQNLHVLLDNMAETMYSAKGVGLAAPQVGIGKRVIIVDAGEGLLEVINPVIVSGQGEDLDIEGCLSLPGVQGEVPRLESVAVAGYDRRGAAIEINAKGLLARALQHEIDHLDGILFIDKAVRQWRED